MRKSIVASLIIIVLVNCYQFKYTDKEIINLLKSRDNKTYWPLLSKQLLENKEQEKVIANSVWRTLNPINKSQIDIKEFLENVSQLPGLSRFYRYFTTEMKKNKGIMNTNNFDSLFKSFLKAQSQGIIKMIQREVRDSPQKNNSSSIEAPQNIVNCEGNLLLLANQCVPCTDSNQYKDLENRLCSICDPECKRCASTNTCDACPEGYIINESGKCKACIDPSCKLCADGSFFLEGACKPCISKCARCEEKSKCLQCSEGFYLNSDGSCSLCDTKGVFKKNSKECRNCEVHCEICSSKNDCSKCESGFYLLYGKCVPCNQEGYFIQGENCKPCSQGCKLCSDEATCQACIAGQFLQSNNCSASCDINKGFFIALNSNGGQVCQKCSDPNCVVCNDKTCQTCSSQHVLFQGACVDCSNPEERARLSQEARSNCLICPKNCKECFSETKCFLCQDNYFLTSTAQCTLCNAPGETQSLDLLSRNFCISCALNCIKCANPNFCLKCAPNFFLSFGTCLPCNTATMVMIPEQQTCKPCGPLCSSCTNSVNCNKCLPLFYSLNGDCFPCLGANYIDIGLKDGSGTCVSPCKTGEFLETTANNHKVCSRCPENCLTCETGLLCITCKPQFFKSNGTCISCDKPGQLKAPDESGHGECHSCEENCEVCFDLNSCHKCIEGFSLTSSGRCVVTCLAGLTVLYIDPVGRRVCKDICVKNCARCGKNGVCEHCDSNYFLSSEGKICSTCTGTNEKRAMTEQNIPYCYSCLLKNCLSCDQNSNCKICNTGYYLKNGQCTTCTGMGEFLTADNRCVACGTNCMFCQSETTCQICNYGYVSEGAGCITELEAALLEALIVKLTLNLNQQTDTFFQGLNQHLSKLSPAELIQGKTQFIKKKTQDFIIDSKSRVEREIEDPKRASFVNMVANWESNFSKKLQEFENLNNAL